MQWWCATLLSIAGLPLPEGISGEAFGGELLVSELYEQKAGLGEHRALFRGRYKLMWFANKRRPELYDLRRDPTEQVDLASLEPETARALEQVLRDWESSHRPRASRQPQRSGESHQELLRQMKVLGYVE